VDIRGALGNSLDLRGVIDSVEVPGICDAKHVRFISPEACRGVFGEREYGCAVL
jgi:hypothetical protein